jgi:hypothetical protein
MRNRSEKSHGFRVGDSVSCRCTYCRDSNLEGSDRYIGTVVDLSVSPFSGESRAKVRWDENPDEPTDVKLSEIRRCEHPQL